MLRIYSEEDGVRFILLVLEPENILRMTHGEPIGLDLRQLATDLIGQPLRLIVEAPHDFEARKQELKHQAVAQGATVVDTSKPTTH